MKLSDGQCDILHSGVCLACRTEKSSDRWSWLLITPFKIDPETGMSTLNACDEPWQYRIRHFGIPVGFDYSNYDLHPEYVKNYLNEVVLSVVQIENVIDRIIVDSNRLVESRSCDCPL